MAKSDNGELNNSNLLASSNNSDPNNSLLQKVTKRVSGLIPSSITKWFGPSDGGGSVIRRRETEDDEEEQLQIQQPPKKRAKPTTTSTSTTQEMEFTNHFQMTSTPLMNSRGPSNYSRHTITSVLYDADNRPSTSGSSAGGRGEPCVNGGGAPVDDKSSDDSGESTSGYSSVLVQQNKETSFVSDVQPKITTKTQSSMKESNSSPSPNKSLNTSRSLFSDQSLNPQRQCLNSRRPSFNSSTFGSPTFVDRTLSTKRAVNSPFYGGRTVYGGASAYRRNRIIFPRNDRTQIPQTTVSMKPVNETGNENVSLSKTARRILDTLEHFSTPIVDAKKIPNIKRLQTPYARDQTFKPVTRELIVPSVPDLLKMKQKERLQNSTEQVRKLATTSKSVLNEYSIRTLVDETTTKPQKHTTKIKAKISSVREKKNELNDTVDAVQLPEIQLPITSLPKFDFTLPTPPAPLLSTVTKLPTPEKQIPNTNEYKFSAPITVKKSGSSSSIMAINHFKFSEPIDAKKPASTSTTMITFKGESLNTAPRKKDPKNNGQNTPEYGFNLKPSEKLSEGSVMDILGGKSIMDKFKPSIGTWECQACMVRNIPTATRCIACETLKEPIKKPEPPKTTNLTNNTFGNQFKMSAEKWECGVCMVRNNSSDTKCVACTTPNPKNSTTTVVKTPTPTNTTGSFGDKFKPASNTWECDACMIRNKSEDVKCVACETPKKGATPTDANKKPSLIMNIASGPTSGGFGDFIKKQQTSWECPSCMVRNPPEKKACVCCEAPKPGEKQEFSFGSASGGTQFKFGILGNANDSSTSTATATPPKTGFTFGATTASNPVTSGFTFGVKPTESQTSTTASATFSFGAPTTTPTPTTQPTTVVLNGDPKKLFSFGTQSTTVTSTSSTTKSTNIFNPIVPSASESSNNSTVSSTVTVTTTSTVPPTTTFSFGVAPKLDDKKTTSAVTTAATTTPQFNFGGSSSSLPFNPVFGSANNVSKTNSFETTTTTANTAFSFKPTTTPILPTATNNTLINNNNKTTEIKPFSFTTTTTSNNKTNETTSKSKFPEFTFNPLTTNSTTSTAVTAVAAPLSKAPVINFGSVAEKPTPPTNSMFSFGATTTKPENKAPSFGGGSMFGQSSSQGTSTPQNNGGFNFGATAVTPNFNFGGTPSAAAGTTANSNSTQTTASNLFGFGSSQAGSGSTAPALGVFTFGGGGGSSAQQQQPAAGFTPDIKPNFNFSGGTPIASFTAQQPPPTMPQRKIRKAVRRTQPR